MAKWRTWWSSGNMRTDASGRDPFNSPAKGILGSGLYPRSYLTRSQANLDCPIPSSDPGHCSFPNLSSRSPQVSPRSLAGFDLSGGLWIGRALVSPDHFSNPSCRLPNHLDLEVAKQS